MKHILLTCICLLFASGALFAQKPIVYLPLDTDLKDASGNDLHATDAGTAPTEFVNDAQRGAVAKFPVAAHATLPLNKKLDFGTKDFSVAFWIKVDNSGTLPTSDPAILGNKDWGSGGNVGFVVALDGADDPGGTLWKVNAADEGSARLDWNANEQGVATLVDGTWHFVAVTFDRDATMNVYVDGVLKQDLAGPDAKDMTLVPGDMAPDDLPFTIMQDATGQYSADFEGFLDDILIYNRVLSGDEISVMQEIGYIADPSFGATVYLPFNGDLKDFSENKLNAKDAGSENTTFVEDADRGTVASFSAPAYITLPVNPKLDFGTNDFSVAFWMKVDDTPPLPSSDPAILGNKDWGSGGNKGFIVALNNADNPAEDMWKVNAADGDGQRLDWAANENGAPNLVDGTWHFVAVTFDRDATMKIYFDGEAKGGDADMSTVPGDMAPDDRPFTIMQDITGAYSADFASLMDEIRIWNGTVLTANEVKKMYLAPPNLDTGGDDLTFGADVYLPLDADLNDISGNNVNAENKGEKPVEFVEDGQRGKVASFPVEAYAQFPLADQLDFGTGDFSFSLWIKVDNKLPVASDPSIFSNKDWNSGDNAGFILALDGADEADSHHWTLNVSDGAGDRLDWDADDNNTPSLKDGKWHFITATFDRDANLNVYYDGILRQSDPAQDSHDLTLTPGSLTSGLPLTIMQDGTGHYDKDFAAWLDDIRIWKGKVLTSQEVLAMYRPEDQSYDAVVFLPLNNSLLDYSGNSVDATDMGIDATEFVRDPDRGEVASFGATAYAQLPLAPQIDFGMNDFSVGFWVRIPGIPATTGDPVIIGNKDWASGENVGFAIGPVNPDDGSSHRWYSNIADGVNRLDWNADENEAANLKDSEWHFVVVSYDRDAKMNVYLDGGLKQTSTDPFQFDMTKITGTVSSGLPVTIMQDATGAYSSDFVALLDNIRIWDRVVTAGEVSDIFSNDKGSGQGGEEEIILGDIKEEAKTFVAYPNPVQSGTNIYVKYQFRNPSDIRVSMMDIHGREVHSLIERAGTEGTISFEAPAAAGLYVIKVQSLESTHLMKIIINR